MCFQKAGTHWSEVVNLNCCKAVCFNHVPWPLQRDWGTHVLTSDQPQCKCCLTFSPTWTFPNCLFCTQLLINVENHCGSSALPLMRLLVLLQIAMIAVHVILQFSLASALRVKWLGSKELKQCTCDEQWCLEGRHFFYLVHHFLELHCGPKQYNMPSYSKQLIEGRTLKVTMQLFYNL